MSRLASYLTSSPWLKTGFYLLALIYLLLALVFVVERVIQQQLPNYRQQLERQLSANTGLEWSLQGLSLEFRRLNPIVRARRVTATTSPESGAAMAPAEVLRLDNPEVYIDLGRSLLHRQPSFYGLRSDQVELLLVRQSGRWLPPGWQLPESDGALDLPALLRNLRYITLPAIQILALDTEKETMPVFSVDFQRRKAQRQLVVQQHGQDHPLQPTMRFGMTGEPGQPDLGFQVYVVAVEDSLSRWINKFFASSELGFIEGEILLDKPAGQDLQGVAMLRQASMTLSNLGKSEDASVDVSAPPSLVARPFSMLFEQDSDSRYQARWPALAFELAGERIDLQPGRLSWWPGPVAGGSLSLQMPLLHLDYVTLLLTGSEIWQEILGERGVDAVRTLAVAGELHDLDLRIPLARPSRFELRSRFEQLAVRPYGNAPGGSGVNGQLSVAATAGWVQLDTQGPLTLEFPSVYPAPLAFNGAEGSVEWLVDDSRIIVSGDELALGSAVDDGNFFARFATNGRLSGDEASTLTLEIGVERARVENLLAYLPKTVSGGLKNWLDGSGATGNVQRGGFIYHGSLRRGEGGRRSVNMFFDLDDAMLSYHPDWPLVSGLGGRLQVTNADAVADIATAHTAGFDLADVDFSLFRDEGKQYVAVDTSLAGDTGKLLEFLQQAPLGEGLNQTLSDWEASGEFEAGQLSLQLPLTNPNQSNINIDVALDLKESALQMHNLDLSFSAINGPLAYSDKYNLRSTGLEAEFWGQPFKVEMGGRQLGGEVSDILARGKVDVDNVRDWLQQPVLGFARGSADFSIELAISGGESAIEVRSDLQGVAIDLPPPLLKTSTAPLPLDLNWSINKAGQPLVAALGELAWLTLSFSDYNFRGGSVQLRADPELDAKPPVVELAAIRNGELYRDGSLTLSGNIDHFNITEWLPVIRRYIDMAESQEADTGASKASTPPILLAGREIQVGQTEFLDQPYYQTVVDFDSHDSRWVFRLENSILQGSVSLPESLLDEPAVAEASTDDMAAVQQPVGNGLAGVAGFLPQLPQFPADEQRIRLDLNYLRLPASTLLGDRTITEPETPFLSPSTLLPLDVSVEQLYLGNDSLGAWKFLLTASDSTALVHNIEARSYALNISSDDDDGLLWAVDERGRTISSLRAHVSSGDFGGFLGRIRDEQEQLPMSSERMKADVALDWTGSPDAIALDMLSGVIDFEFKDGRFYQAPQSATGLLKLLGLINFDTIVRRVQLDFADVYKEGLRFDSITGEFLLEDNRLSFNKPAIVLEAPSSRFRLSGALDLNTNSIDAELVATLPVANNLPWFAAIAGGLPGAAGAYVVKEVFGDQIERLSSASYRIQGNIDDPEVSFDKLFKN